MALNNFQGDELGVWQGTITINGTTPDLSTGWTFTVTMSKAGETTLTKTTGITGATGGRFTVNWAQGELNRTAGAWRVQITLRRTADGFEHTEQDTLNIKPRTLAEAP